MGLVVVRLGGKGGIWFVGLEGFYRGCLGPCERHGGATWRCARWEGKDGGVFKVTFFVLGFEMGVEEGGGDNSLGYWGAGFMMEALVVGVVLWYYGAVEVEEGGVRWFAWNVMHPVVAK